MFDLTPGAVALMAIIFAVVAVTFVICIRRELK